MRELLIKTFFLALIAMPFAINQALAQEGGKPDACMDASARVHTVPVAGVN